MDSFEDDAWLVIDGYEDEPAAFGVPPYIGFHIRYLCGVLESMGIPYNFFTIDAWRRLKHQEPLHTPHFYHNREGLHVLQVQLFLENIFVELLFPCAKLMKSSLTLIERFLWSSVGGLYVAGATGVGNPSAKICSFAFKIQMRHYTIF